MQRCTGHDSGKLHFKKCYCRCVLLLMTTAVMLLHSCCCHFCIFCCLFCFSSPSSFGYSKQARRHAKQWERFRGWKRLKKREHEGWRGIEKARLPYRRQSLSNKTHGKKKRHDGHGAVRTSEHVRTASLSAIILTCHRPPTEPQREVTRLCGRLCGPDVSKLIVILASENKRGLSRLWLGESLDVQPTEGMSRSWISCIER